MAHPLRSSSIRRAVRMLGTVLALALGSCAPEKLTPEQYYGGAPPEDVTAADTTVDDSVSPDLVTGDPDAGAEDASGTDAIDSVDVATEEIAADDALTPEVLTDDVTGDDTTLDDLGGTDGDALDNDALDNDALDNDALDNETTDDISAPDTSTCVPQCINKFCGDDGCGGVCGNCGDTKYCSTSFKCIPKCIPQCFKKLCGPDQCGGSCGTCNSGFECGADGKCYDTTCTPNCEGRVCGDDGCSGSCGQCAPGDLCDAGQCVLGPCSGVPFDTGKCEDGMAKLCIGTTQLIVKDCTSLVDKKCGWNPQIPAYDCIAATECFPTCLNKECGDDGCGGLCGSCPSGWPCANGACIPTGGGGCGYYNTVGTCENDVLWYCEAQTLQREDCGLVGKSCQFNPTVPANQCL